MLLYGKATAFCALLPLVAFSATSQSIMEQVWQDARTYSSQLREAELEESYAWAVLLAKGMLYPLSLSASVSTDFNDVYTDTVWYAQEATAGISVSKPLPGGLSVTGGLSYDMAKNFLDPYKGYDRDNTGYIHAPTVSLSLSQSLCPYWAQRIKQDPNTVLLKNTVSQKEVTRELVEKSIILTVTYAVIQFRQAARLAEVTQNRIAYYDSYIEAMQKTVLKGGGSMTDVWQMDEERQSCIQQLSEYKRTMQSTLDTICLYCGNIDMQFMTTLPEQTVRLYGENLDERLLSLQREQAEVQYALTRQNNAPVLTIKGGISEYSAVQETVPFDYIEEKDSLAWSFSVGLDFSQLFTKQSLLQKQEYQNDIESYNLQLRDTVAQHRAMLQMYSEFVQMYNDYVAKDTETAENRKAYYDAIQDEHRRGVHTQLDVMAARGAYDSAVCALENDRDMVWFYKWLYIQQ